MNPLEALNAELSKPPEQKKEERDVVLQKTVERLSYCDNFQDLEAAILSGEASPLDEFSDGPAQMNPRERKVLIEKIHSAIENFVANPGDLQGPDVLAQFGETLKPTLERLLQDLWSSGQKLVALSQVDWITDNEPTHRLLLQRADVLAKSSPLLSE